MNRELVTVISVLLALNEMLSSPLYTVQLLKWTRDERIVSQPSVFAGLVLVVAYYFTFKRSYSFDICFPYCSQECYLAIDYRNK